MKLDLNYLLSSSMAPAQERIMSYLGPPDFAIPSRLSKSVNVALKTDALPSCYNNIDSKLLALFKYPKGFRGLQARTGAIIGDDFARKFVGNQLHHPVDRLHLYVEDSVNGPTENLGLIRAYLECEGWNLVDESNNRIFKRSGAEDDGVRIQVKLSRGSPLALLLLQAASTATFNSITWNKAYSMFPQMTFAENEYYVLQKLEPSSKPGDTGRREYAGEIMGLSEDGILTKLLYWEDEKENIITRIRRIGDKLATVLGLDVSGIDNTIVATPDIYVESSTFRILPFEGTDQDRGMLKRYELNCGTCFNHAISKNSWVTFGEPERWTYGSSTLNQQFNRLWDHATDLTHMELMKLPAESRPTNIDHLLQRSNDYLVGSFAWPDRKVPTTWSYYDKAFLKQVSKFWKEHENNEREGKGMGCEKQQGQEICNFV